MPSQGDSLALFSFKLCDFVNLVIVLNTLFVSIHSLRTEIVYEFQKSSVSIDIM